MNASVTDKLSGLGLDVDFLAWLEGKSDRLPRLHGLAEVKDEDLAAAIRAAVWLKQLFSDPALISPQAPDQWLKKYRLLDQFLSECLRYRMMIADQSKDLEKLESVLTMLLPDSSWKQHREDIAHLRRRGMPQRFEYSSVRSGGKPESEQTDRMRAAVRYISEVSKTPYVDLAAFWNERFGTGYLPDEIKDRLRIKSRRRAVTGADGYYALERWRSAYALDLIVLFPGPFPLSSEFADLVARRSVKS
jgi:hypothetical protein